MLRRVQWAPIILAVSFCAWGFVAGCQATGADLGNPLPVAQGGSSSSATGGVSNNNGGNANSQQGGQTATGQGGGSTSTNTGQGGATGNGGNASTGGSTSTSSNTGGSTSTSATGGAKPTGGSSSTGNGGTTTSATGGATTTSASGGATTTTTATGVGGATVVTQTCTTDLMTLATGDKNNWIVNSTGKSCGVQGAIYAFGDGTSLTKPAAAAGSTTDRETPCSAPATAGGPVKCCISGTTQIGADATYWGAGIGLDLNASGTTKSAYTGAAKGFAVTLTGTFPSATAKIRIAYAGAGVTTEPYKEIPAAAGTYNVLYSDATCPSWATASACSAVTAPTQLKIQLVGGGTVAANVGAYDFCISTIMPST